MSTKIDWCKNPDGSQGYVHNITRGCPRGCLYCYGPGYSRRFGIAKKMAEKEMKFLYGQHWPAKYDNAQKDYEILKEKLYNYKPVFLNYRLAQKLRKKPTMYFFSMSDPEFWEQEWYEKILKKICQHMEHTFVVLTKSPEIYKEYTFPHNCWLGVTCVNQRKLNEFDCLLANSLEVKNKLFISIEPIMEKIKINLWMRRRLDWIIVGPETGNRKNRIIAKPEWIEPFFDLMDIPVYMKSACSKVIDRPLRQEMPEGY